MREAKRFWFDRDKSPESRPRPQASRQGRRLAPSVAAQLIESSVLPYASVQALSGKDVMLALADCEPRGVRGGAVYDYLHVFAARKAGAEAVLTLDVRDFQAIARQGDPPIAAP